MMKVLILIFSFFMWLQNDDCFVDNHPVYMSVTDIVYDSKQKNVEMICKIFANDFEMVLKKYHKGVDLLNPDNKGISSQWIKEYVQKNLKIKINTKPIDFQFVGFERDGDAILVYFSASTGETPKEIIIQNSLLYDFKTEQMNIMHVEIHGERKSRKLTHPETMVKFDF